MIAVLDQGQANVGTGEAHTCALRSDHTVWCWGSNRFDALGGGPDSTTPRRVDGITAVQQIAVGQNHTCARLADGSVKCWGTTVSGSPPGSIGTYGPTPVTIAGTAGSVDVRASRVNDCVRFADGHLACWGVGDDGAIGDGSTTSTMTATPVVFP